MSTNQDNEKDPIGLSVLRDELIKLEQNFSARMREMTARLVEVESRLETLSGSLEALEENVDELETTLEARTLYPEEVSERLDELEAGKIDAPSEFEERCRIEREEQEKILKEEQAIEAEMKLFDLEDRINRIADAEDQRAEELSDSFREIVEKINSLERRINDRPK